MKKIITFIALGSILFLNSCTKGSYDYSPSESLNDGTQGQAGLITAGEWNDLSNWDFWNNLLNGQDYSNMPAYWDIYTNHRMSILVENNGIPILNAKVELIKNDAIIWTARTDNFGRAELWIGIFQKEESINSEEYSIKVNDEIQNMELFLFAEGINVVNINSVQNETNRVEISFIVDATGSMGDELEFLKEDLKSVIDSVKVNNRNINIYTSAVFYRDEGDEYVTRKSEFTNDLSQTIAFINQQSASGGGDFPEAVHSALSVGINELQWSDVAKTRIAFLLLDAPPHYTTSIVGNIHNTIKVAANKGIKIIPITASGIDEETEFLTRFIANLTNGTYVFITSDSGIGNDHLEPSVGDYQVEYLNDLLVRLIKKYSE